MHIYIYIYIYIYSAPDPGARGPCSAWCRRFCKPGFRVVVYLFDVCLVRSLVICIIICIRLFHMLLVLYFPVLRASLRVTVRESPKSRSLAKGPNSRSS